jgi:imidazolonepropionase
VAELGIPAGIPATVRMTRAASDEQLFASAAARLRGMFWSGATTVEAKSGYGLTVADELRMLQVGRRLNAAGPVDVVNTFLGAHEFPSELSRARYIDLIVSEMIPQVAERGLAEFCDVYIDDGYYTVPQARRILEAARSAGLRLKTHTDAYSDIGGAHLSAELGVISADHLNYTTPTAAQALADAGVTGVVMPLLDWAVAHSHPFEAQALTDAGLELALATDLCPACWTESMQLVMQFACRQYRFSPEEALLASTVRGARALGLTDRGALAAGQLADLQLWRTPSFEDVIYRLGGNAVKAMIKRGRFYELREFQDD